MAVGVELVATLDKDGANIGISTVFSNREIDVVNDRTYVIRDVVMIWKTKEIHAIRDER